MGGEEAYRKKKTTKNKKRKAVRERGRWEDDGDGRNIMPVAGKKKSN